MLTELVLVFYTKKISLGIRERIATKYQSLEYLLVLPINVFVVYLHKDSRRTPVKNILHKQENINFQFGYKTLHFSENQVPLLHRENPLGLFTC